MFRSRRLKPEATRLTLSVDEEGVVRVVDCSEHEVTLTPDDLARLLTGLVKAICGTGDDDETVDVHLN